MKFSVKLKSIMMSGCTAFILVGCTSAVHPPNNFKHSSVVKSETSTIEIPATGEISTVELGDTLVSKQVFEAIKGITLTKEHIITNSGEKREAMREHCWLSKLKSGYYIAEYENADYLFYSHTSSPSTDKPSGTKCDNGGFTSFGVAQSKKSKDVYKSWYKKYWNMNEDKVDINNINIEPFISEKGVFKQEFYYNGKVGSQLKFSYREFTEDGFARNSFSQDVVYDLNDSTIIGFKGAKFEIVTATNSSIEYKVISHFK